MLYFLFFLCLNIFTFFSSKAYRMCPHFTNSLCRICILLWEYTIGLLYLGEVAQAAIRLMGAWLQTERPGFYPERQMEWIFFFAPSFPDWPWGPLSLLRNKYQGFPEVKTVDRRASYPTSSLVRICRPLNPYPPWTFVVCNGDTFTFYIYIYTSWPDRRCPVLAQCLV